MPPAGSTRGKRQNFATCVDARFGARRIFWIGAARGQVLTCVRPLMRLTRRRPGWEFADQVQIMCGRPLWRKKNFLDWCSARSGADMCAAFDAAHTPQARMGVRGSGPNQSHALEAPVAKLVFLIPSQ